MVCGEMRFRALLVVIWCHFSYIILSRRFFSNKSIWRCLHALHGDKYFFLICHNLCIGYVLTLRDLPVYQQIWNGIVFFYRNFIRIRMNGGIYWMGNTSDRRRLMICQMSILCKLNGATWNNCRMWAKQYWAIETSFGISWIDLLSLGLMVGR